MKSYKIGLVVGRFQPFHLGHKFLIDEALKVTEKLIIGIGSSNVSDLKNPYSYEMRKKFLEEFINQENLSDKILKLVPIVDDPDDTVWLTKLKKTVGTFHVGIGDNEWVNGILTQNKIPVVRVGLFQRAKLEGKVIRKRMRDNKKWEDRVPPYLVEKLSKL